MKAPPVLILILVLSLGCRDRRTSSYEAVIGEYHAYIPEQATYANGGFCDTLCSVDLILDDDLTYSLSVKHSDNLKVTSYSGYWELKDGEIELLPAARQDVSSPWYKRPDEQSAVATKYWTLQIRNESELVGHDFGFDIPVRFQREFIIF